MGFSTSKPDIRSVISLSEYFSDVTMDPTDFFGNMIKSNRHQVKQQIWGVLEQATIDKNAWKVNAQSVQVSYNRELNKVMIPGGLLQRPLIDASTPAYFYYGTIGWMIGHEIMVSALFYFFKFNQSNWQSADTTCPHLYTAWF